MMDILQLIKDNHVALFYVGILLLLFLFRKKFVFQGIIALYRTQFGIRWIDYISKKLREPIKLFGFISIGIAYVGMLGITILLIKSAWDLLLAKPAAAGASLVLPGLPIAGTGLVFPLIIGWITLFIIILVHEGAHGVVAKAFNHPIKSTGIVFLGPILGAFVEPDEKKLAKASSVEQYSIYAAGPISNVVLAALAFLIMLFITTPLFAQFSEGDGIKIGITEGYPAKEAGLLEGSIITDINGKQTHDIAALTNVTGNLKPNETIIVTAYNLNDKSPTPKNYTFLTAANPDDSSKGYMGITLQEAHRIPAAGKGFLFAIVKWFNDLMFWIYFISINIGLINLFPIFITDGARMLYTSCNDIITDKKKAIRVWKSINIIAIMILLILVLVPIGQMLWAKIPLWFSFLHLF